MATYFKIIYGFIFALLCLCFKGSGTQCSSENHFGPNCDFICHCMNNEKCNTRTGNCPSGCDFDWVGPACQHNNIVPAGQTNGYEMVVRQQSNIPQMRIASLAVDRDLSTCSHTNYANMSKDIPWWRLWLKDKYKIRNISIITTKESLDYFKNFEVLVENQTFRSRYGYGFASQDVCYKHANSSPRTTNIDVTCNKSIYGNQLRIRLATNGTQLVLCDVRIHGECSDGTFGGSCTEKCNTHCEDVCNKDYGTCSLCSPGWTGISCNQECQNGTFGAECTSTCSTHCKNNSVCLYTNGSCTNGCDPGWIGKTCMDVCADGYYGHKCLQKCSTNCEDGYSKCDNIYGTCMSGCIAGWKGRKCDEVCPTGSWGINCRISCGYCVSGKCRHTDGVCDGGCSAGVKSTSHCDEECNNGSYGINCSRICSKNCKDICKKQTGECEYCTSGWHGAKCTLECEDERWGENCNRTCFTCRNEICNRISGACYSQCKPGFKQTKYCNQECSTGWYGFNCSKECNLKCKNATFCSKTDGSCSECKPGLEGKMCENAIKQTVTESTMHISVGGVAAIVLSVIVLTVFSFIVAVLVRKRRLRIHGNHSKSENETVSYLNVLAADATSAVPETPESNLNMETESGYDIIERKSGVEHSYEQRDTGNKCVSVLYENIPETY